MDEPEIPEKIKAFFRPLLKSESQVFTICSEFLQTSGGWIIPYRACLGLLPQYGISPEAVGQNFTNLVIEAKNSSRIWKNKGFTPPGNGAAYGNCQKHFEKSRPKRPVPLREAEKSIKNARKK